MANKLKRVNPNEFQGSGLGSNAFVSPEDLTIYVELTTSRKGRTVLTSNGTTNSTPPVTVRFIEGENINGKRSLTTKFTELTTSFDDSQSSENLGITAIDIDFNSSFAPLITINFIDVRGSAIFQNESKTANNENKYSVFFQLPYPLYKLKIKGYYGKPVEYCLHMTKFTSRFNSQTGNFEITASFVGYTYAMLSDMLIGFLKAISYTSLGKEKYSDLERIDGEKILTVDDLYKTISAINEAVKKILPNDENYAQSKLVIEKLAILDGIKLYLEGLSNQGGTIDLSPNKTEYSFIITDVDAIKPIFFDTYKQQISLEIENFNKDSTITLDKKTFKDLIIYKNLSIELLSGNTLPTPDTPTQNEILGYIQRNYYSLANVKTFDVVDLRNLFTIIENKKSQINATDTELKNQLAETLSVGVRAITNFDPSIRNIIKTFTDAAEVFMYCIHKVSTAAITSEIRKTELQKAFKIEDDSDIPSSVTSENAGSTSVYYPWPDYRELDDKRGYVEKYLGECRDINPRNIDELVFIDDLLRAFIRQAQEQNNIDLLTEAQQTNWIPSNPLDTRVFGNESTPYQRITSYTTQDDLLTLILIRAFTFLCITNNQDTLSNDEIEQMADFEAQAILKYVKEQTIIKSLSTYDINKLTDVRSNVNGITTVVAQSDIRTGYNGVNYKYNYILPGDERANKYLPINTGFIDDDWSNVKNNGDNGYLFLGNRGVKKPPFIINQIINILTLNSELVTLLTGNKKPPNDGSVYIKIIPSNEYYTNDFNKVIDDNANQEVGVTKKLRLSELKKGEITDFYAAGFYTFSGQYGIQEFSLLEWEDSSLNETELPLRYLFYSNIDSGLASGNGLGGKRTKTDNDIESEKYLVNTTTSSYEKDFLFSSSFREKRYNFGVYENYGKTRQLINNDINTINYPYINFTVDEYQYINAKFKTPVSLFGSRFYNEQKTNEAKAFLFLHTFPWNGLNYKRPQQGLVRTIFINNEIINLFKNRAGFVSAPKLWAAFIGGLLWRYQESVDPIIFSEPVIGGTTSFIPTYDEESEYPAKDRYLSYFNNNDLARGDIDEYSMSFTKKAKNEGTGVYVYKPIDYVLLSLPQQAKNEFINIFRDFVSNDWLNIKNDLELTISTNISWTQTYNQISTLNGGTLSEVDEKYYLDKASMKSYYGPNFDNYIIFNPLSVDGVKKAYKYNYFLDIKPSAPIKNTLINLLKEEVIISNMSYRIWGGVNENELNIVNQNFTDIILKKDIAETYFKKFFSNFKDITVTPTEEQIKQNLFGTTDTNVIKFMLYRTCKNIYDKWVANSKDGNAVFFQCGGRGPTDSELAKKRTNGVSTTPRLIDSFRFVNRSFTDIGDEFAVNPFPIYDIIRNGPNISLYDMISSILSSNNFDFVALPSFINYKDEKDVKSVFTPYPIVDEGLATSVGPSFVCVYVGQKSKHLDFGKKNNNYTNDGFDFYNESEVPKDFTDTLSDYDDPVAYFDVTYGQQNQNIFKDVVLDQNEFSETAESLQIMEDISTKGAETNRSFAGQNIYNVYAVRSYKVEVEMMGDAMIQPMMYFQLNNIPMFHGAYMITRVKHSIKPNHMSTNFTGVRIRKPTTEIFTAGDLFASLLETINTANLAPRTATQPFGSTAGSGSLGVGCGNKSVPTSAGGVSNSGEFYKSKPIRDLIASYESGSCDKNYNAYNYYTPNLVSVTPCSNNNNGALVPLTMTIGDIKQKQKNRTVLHAVGKYQCIQGTFKDVTDRLQEFYEGSKNYKYVTKPKGPVTDNTIFDEYLQEVVGEYLIFASKTNLIKYFNGDGNENDLVNSISDLAGTWAALPSYHGVVDNKIVRSSVIGYNSNTAVYGGLGGNAGVSKYCAQDVAKALIETWQRCNPSKTIAFDYDKVVARAQSGDNCTKSQPITISNTSTSVIMGSSTVGVLNKNNFLKNEKIDISFNCEGKTVSWLVGQLKNDVSNIYKNVKLVFVAIGTNDGYQDTGIKEFNDLINKKFPNAKKVVLPGTIGWGTVINKTKQDQDQYYAKFVNLGWVYEYPNASAIAKDVGEAHNSDSPWFKSLRELIDKIKKQYIV